MNGILNRELNRAAGKKVTGEKSLEEQYKSDRNSSRYSITFIYKYSCLSFLYPFGATLNVQKPAIPLLSSGSVSYPLNRPVGAVYISPVC